MITGDKITLIGRFGKPHGVTGEINVVTYDDIDIGVLSCLVVDIDGINVPFFCDNVRPRGNESFLVTIDGLESDEAVGILVNKDIYCLKNEVAELGDDEDGFYASDLIGYKVCDSALDFCGEIVDVDDSTENVLFVVKPVDGDTVLVPVADEFILNIDIDSKTIEMNLPQGLI